MDQKNTIVKCKAHPNCLFNHNGVCDQYVIHVGVKGECQEYYECEESRHEDNLLMMNKPDPPFTIPKNCHYCQHMVYGLSSMPYCEKRRLLIDIIDNDCDDFLQIKLNITSED